eukprot:11027671-Ditylum_brightwellii.AAC.1
MVPTTSKPGVIGRETDLYQLLRRISVSVKDTVDAYIFGKRKKNGGKEQRKWGAVGENEG